MTPSPFGAPRMTWLESIGIPDAQHGDCRIGSADGHGIEEMADVVTELEPVDEATDHDGDLVQDECPRGTPVPFASG
jgi:hypothetical protein